MNQNTKVSPGPPNRLTTPFNTPTVSESPKLTRNPPKQLLQEIESRAIASQQQISLTKAHMTAKQRDIRMLQLTSKELSELPSETNVYEGCGKM